MQTYTQNSFMLDEKIKISLCNFKKCVEYREKLHRFRDLPGSSTDPKDFLHIFTQLKGDRSTAHIVLLHGLHETKSARVDVLRLLKCQQHRATFPASELAPKLLLRPVDSSPTFCSSVLTESVQRNKRFVLLFPQVIAFCTSRA